jgi:hypothetical protein
LKAAGSYGLKSPPARALKEPARGLPREWEPEPPDGCWESFEVVFFSILTDNPKRMSIPQNFSFWESQGLFSGICSETEVSEQRYSKNGSR